MALTLKDLRQTIRELLGFGTVEVELLDAHLDRAIELSLKTYNRYLPGHNWRSVMAAPGFKGRVWLNHPGIVDVYNCQFLNTLQLSAQDLVENPFVLDALLLGGDAFVQAGEYQNYLQGIRDSRTVFSAKPEWWSQWEVDAGVRKCFLYLRMPYYTPYNTAYEYLFQRELSDNLEVGLPSVMIAHESWVVNFAAAQAKIILGHVRDKFKGIPSPDGGDMMTDGSDMIAEGKGEVADLTSEILAMQPQLPPIHE